MDMFGLCSSPGQHVLKGTKPEAQGWQSLGAESGCYLA